MVWRIVLQEQIMKILARVPVLFLLLTFSALAPSRELVQGEAAVTLPPELQRVLDDYEAAWRSKNAAGLAQLFAEDGLVLAPGEDMVRGRAAIQKLYAGWGGPLYLRPVTFAMEGNVGYIIGGFSHDRGTSDDGKFTLTLRKASSGRWLIFSDMDNGNRKQH
jgi:ketosteroid isomerase-like protein